MADMEIQNGGSLTVRESQMAVFVNEGKVADVFGPGTYKLTTQTLPVLTYLKNWDKLFESPFKSDVYFFSTRQQVDQKWGTPQPITIRDAGLRRRAPARVRQLRLPHRRPEDCSTPKSRAPATPTRCRTWTASCAAWCCRTSAMPSPQSGIPFLDLAANQH
jgi:hypothetical protein